MSSYQPLERYNGSMYGEPRYQGLEYDFEVPNNLVVSSAGGNASTMHHYTKGFYGGQASYADGFGGQGYRYPYGEYGNLYTQGQNAPQAAGYYPAAPDRRYWRAESPPPSWGQPLNPNAKGPVVIGGGSTAPLPSNTGDSKCTNGLDFELIEPSDIEPFGDAITTTTNKHEYNFKFNPILLFVILIAVSIILSFWDTAAQDFVQQRIFKGKPISYTTMALIAAVLTAALVALVYFSKFPLVTFVSRTGI